MKTLRIDTIDRDLLQAAGFRIEGPREGDCAFWWTLYRDGWSGVECGADVASESDAWLDAAGALIRDEDLDWMTLSVRPRARAQFPSDFELRMALAAARSQ
jgi:hypothetical protein